MRAKRGSLFVAWTVICGFSLPLPTAAHRPHVRPEGFPDQPAISGHLHQTDIVDGTLIFDAIV